MSVPVEPTSRYFYSSGLKLHYLEWGDATAPLLILQHGMHDHARSWDWVARALCDRWRVIAPDLRGHGDSEWSPDGAYQTSCYMEDFACLIAQLGVEQFNIIAHSLGGNPTARFAGLYPERVRKLVLVDAMGPTKLALTRWAEQGVLSRAREWLDNRSASAAKTARRFQSIEEAVERMRKAHQNLSAEQAHHLTYHGLRRFDDGYSWKYDPLSGSFNPEDFAIHLSEYWRAITADTLLCWGPKSWNTNPVDDGNAAFFHNATTLTFEQSGHWIHHDQTEAFIDTVAEFLRAE